MSLFRSKVDESRRAYKAAKVDKAELAAKVAILSSPCFI